MGKQEIGFAKLGLVLGGSMLTLGVVASGDDECRLDSVIQGCWGSPGYDKASETGCEPLITADPLLPKTIPAPPNSTGARGPQAFGPLTCAYIIKVWSNVAQDCVNLMASSSPCLGDALPERSVACPGGPAEP